MKFVSKNLTCTVTAQPGWFDYTVTKQSGECVHAGYWESSEADCLSRINAFLDIVPEMEAAPDSENTKATRYNVTAELHSNLVQVATGEIVKLLLIHRYSVGVGSVVEIADGYVSRVIVS